MGDVNIPKSHHLDRRAARLVETLEGPDDLLLKNDDVADILAVSPEWVEGGRHYGYGPEFLLIPPRTIRYTLGSIRKYLAERVRCRCSSEYRKRKK